MRLSDGATRVVREQSRIRAISIEAAVGRAHVLEKNFVESVGFGRVVKSSSRGLVAAEAECKAITAKLRSN
jgi:hypothetical protein